MDGTKGLSKKAVIISFLIVLVIGGSVAAYVLLDLSAKQQYFLAEKQSIEYVSDQARERYEPELNWTEQTEENPTETTLEFSGEYNDSNAMNSFDVMGSAQIINNSKLTITTATDKDKKHMSSQINASMGAIEVGDINFYLTAEKAMFGLPFLDELLQLNGKDLGKLLKEVDPSTFTGQEKLDFNTFFEGTNGVISKDNQAYIKEEYLEMIYDELPKESFEKTEEKVNVNSKAVDTEKISMHLTEEQLKNLMSTVLEKMESDKKLKELISEQVAVQQFGASFTAASMTPDMQDEMSQLISSFETAIKDARKGLDELQIPDGLQSTIWVNDDLIVKRDFSVKFGLTKDEMTALSVNGTQLLKDTKQIFNFELGATDPSGNYTIDINGELKNQENEITDSIKLSFGETELAYKGTETLKNGERDFERIFSYDDTAENGSLVWSGNASYNNDQMKSEHDFSIETPEKNQDWFGLHIEKSAQTIKAVELDTDKNVKNIGDMSMEEIDQYIEMKLKPQFQKWIFGLMSSGGNMKGF